MIIPDSIYLLLNSTWTMVCLFFAMAPFSLPFQGADAYDPERAVPVVVYLTVQDLKMMQHVRQFWNLESKRVERTAGCGRA